MTSVNICYNKSCFVIREVEKEGNRTIITSPSRSIGVRKTAVAFVDDTVFTSNRENYVQKMQK